MIEDVIVNQLVKTLSRLFKAICNCRKNYPELDSLLDPEFHLEDCPYRRNVETYDVQFERPQRGTSN
jgi:hypothetical protein